VDNEGYKGFWGKVLQAIFPANALLAKFFASRFCQKYYEFLI